MKSLKEEIEKFNASDAAQLPQEVADAIAASINEHKQKHIEENGVKVGMTIEPFTLLSSNGEKISSDALLQKYDKLVLSFFRGIWCPYCNLELRNFQKYLPQIESKGAQLLGISPQSPEFSKEMQEEGKLDFEILHDDDNKFARQLGISFTLQDYLVLNFKTINLDLSKFNSNDHNELPIPAVLVIDKSYKVLYAFLDSDFKKRADIDDVLAIL